MMTGQFGENASTAENILIRFLEEKKVKITYPFAISIISAGMGVKNETARTYLDRILLTGSRIKTNYWELWLEG